MEGRAPLFHACLCVHLILAWKYSIVSSLVEAAKFIKDVKIFVLPMQHRLVADLGLPCANEVG